MGTAIVAAAIAAAAIVSALGIPLRIPLRGIFFGRMSDLWRNPDPTRPKKIRKYSLFQGCIPSHCNVNFQVTLLIKKCVFPKKKRKKRPEYWIYNILAQSEFK